jgi:tRNA dimethylallyltransferase
LLGNGVSREAPALSGVGYRQMIPVLDGAMSREDGVALWKQESRRYAKRQETWFSNQLGAQALNANVGADAMAEEVLQVLGHYLEAAATNSGGPSAGG